VVVGIGLVLGAGFWLPGVTEAHQAGKEQRLPRIGPAPGFTLTSADGGTLGLAGLRGRVVALTFIYAACADTCPLLTAKLVGVGRRLDRGESDRVRFVAITVDPERDTPEVLRRYAEGHGARAPAWAFLTGTPPEIRQVARGYGVFARKSARGDVDHTFLTSIIDAGGTLRVQYLGVRFDPDEFLGDIRSLLREGPAGVGRSQR
jgi:protein SCO1/2